MPLLNPLNVAPTSLTFTRLSTVANTTDSLGNPELASATVTVDDVLVVPLGRDQGDTVRAIVGIEKGGYPFKARAENWPSFILGQQAVTASLVYNGRPATLTLSTALTESGAALKVAPNLGQSFEGILVYT
jgi:hypothetical protein